MSREVAPAEREIVMVLVLVDRAVGPHRNLVGSLNSLRARDNVRLRLFCSPGIAQVEAAGRSRVAQNVPLVVTGRRNEAASERRRI